MIHAQYIPVSILRRLLSRRRRVRITSTNCGDHIEAALKISDAPRKQVTSPGGARPCFEDAKRLGAATRGGLRFRGRSAAAAEQLQGERARRASRSAAVMAVAHSCTPATRRRAAPDTAAAGDRRDDETRPVVGVRSGQLPHQVDCVAEALGAPTPGQQGAVVVPRSRGRGRATTRDLGLGSRQKAPQSPLRHTSATGLTARQLTGEFLQISVAAIDRANRHRGHAPSPRWGGWPPQRQRRRSSRRPRGWARC